MSEGLTPKLVIKKYVKDNGLAGLKNTINDCVCGLDDLCWCVDCPVDTCVFVRVVIKPTEVKEVVEDEHER